MSRMAKHPDAVKEIATIIKTEDLLSDAIISEFVDSYLELKNDCDKLKEGLVNYKKAKSKIAN